MWIRALGVVLVGVAGSIGVVQGQSSAGNGEGWRSARYHGGSSYEGAERIGVDSQGNAYLLGSTSSTDLHAAVVPAAASRGEPEMATFVLKVDRDGQPVYAMSIGIGFGFRAMDIAVDADGAAHILAREGDTTHVLKIDPTGTRRVYHVTFHAQERDPLFPVAIAADDVGSTVLAGSSRSGVFVARLDARGSVFDIGVVPVRLDVRDLAIDGVGDAYVTGVVSSDQFPATPGSLQPQYNGGTCTDVFPPLRGSPRTFPCPDAFLFKMTRSGELAYATHFGGTGWDEGTTVAVDRNGTAVIAGLTRSTDLPTARAIQSRCNPGFSPLRCGDAFIAKVDRRGAALTFSTYLGGTDHEGVNGLAIDPTGFIYVAGVVTGNGLPMQDALQSANAGGRSDGFVTALGPFGDLMWSTYVGGSEDERVVGVGAAGGMVYVGGETTSPGWALGGPAFFGGRDLFSARVLDLRRR